VPVEESKPDPTVLTTEALHREVEQMHRELAALRELLEVKMAERNRAVDQLFALVEDRRVEQKQDVGRNVDAALAAAKEAVAKTETSTAKQLEQLQETFATALRAVTSAVDELKDRVGAVESSIVGLAQNKLGGKETLSGVYALVAFLAAVLVIGGAVAAAGAFGK